MTTTVTVKTRGLGATVSVKGEQVKMGPNSERRFDTQDTLSLSLQQETADQARAREEQEADEQSVPAELAKLSSADGAPAAHRGNTTGAVKPVT